MWNFKVGRKWENQPQIKNIGVIYLKVNPCYCTTFQNESVTVKKFSSSIYFQWLNCNFANDCGNILSYLNNFPENINWTLKLESHSNKLNYMKCLDIKENIFFFKKKDRTAWTSLSNSKINISKHVLV